MKKSVEPDPGRRLAGNSFPVSSLVCLARRYLWPAGYRRLCGAALRIAPVEAIFHEEQRVAQPSSIGKKRSTWNLEMVGDYGNNHRDIKIRMKAPGEIEIALVRKRGPRRGRNRLRWIGHKASRGENRVVRDERPTRKKRRSGFRRGALRAGR